jgi:hypothetical protein
MTRESKVGKLRSQAARYVEKFGAIVSSHLIELAEASGIKAARGIESLLTDEDKLALQRVADPSSTQYQKKTLWLGVQGVFPKPADLLERRTPRGVSTS